MTNHWADLLNTKRGLESLYDVIPLWNPYA